MAEITATVNTNRDYIDLDLDFLAHPSTQDIVVKRQAEAVKRSIRNLVFTQHYERPFHPEIGCKVYRLLFEPLDAYTGIEIQKSIEEVISNFEPRARILKIAVIPDSQENGYTINIHFMIINLNTPVELTFFLERTR